MIRLATFGPKDFSWKVQKSWPETEAGRRLSLDERPAKNRMPNVFVEDFWTYLMGPPAGIQKSKTPSCGGAAKNSGLMGSIDKL